MQTAVDCFSIHRGRIQSRNHVIVNHINSTEPCRDLDTITPGERSWAGNVPNLTKRLSPWCYFYASAEISPTLAVPGELFCMEAFSSVRSKKARSMIQQTCQSRGSAGSAILRTALAGRRHSGTRDLAFHARLMELALQAGNAAAPRMREGRRRVNA
ncbi:MAG UNVERIFIED_CONTAM: hypothetical protein LVR18_30255 [Planctomycetaceae bacterium]